MDEALIRDLIDLAMDRIEKDLHGVTQLADDDKVVYAILASVAANVVNEAAAILAKNMHIQNGTTPSKEAAVGFIFKEILESLGIDWKAGVKEMRK